VAALGDAGTASAAAGLSKAAKKNLRRSQNRAARRSQPAPAALGGQAAGTAAARLGQSVQSAPSALSVQSEQSMWSA
jgi:hypothetical protein